MWLAHFGGQRGEIYPVWIDPWKKDPYNRKKTYRSCPYNLPAYSAQKYVAFLNIGCAWIYLHWWRQEAKMSLDLEMCHWIFELSDESICVTKCSDINDIWCSKQPNSVLKMFPNEPEATQRGRKSVVPCTEDTSLDDIILQCMQYIHVDLLQPNFWNIVLSRNFYYYICCNILLFQVHNINMLNISFATLLLILGTLLLTSFDERFH